MNITITREGGAAVLRLAGRLDGEAALQLAEALEALLREGRRLVTLDLREVTYLSSPGILALQQAHQEYAAARGELLLASPSPAAAEALTSADLLPKLLAPAASLAGAPVAAAPASGDRTRDDWQIPTALASRGTYEVSTRDASAELSCQVHGRAEAGVRVWIDSTDYQAFDLGEPTFALGIGALGTSRDQAAPRLGELVAAAGAVAHLPTVGSQTPDFDVGLGGRAPQAQLVSGLVCRGGFSLLKRFSSPSEGDPVPLSELARVSLEGISGDTAGVVMVAETTGLVGAWLRRSPGVVLFSMYLDVPGIREWLGTTPHPIHQGSTVLIAGVVSRNPDPVLRPHLRPIAPGSGLLGHFHAVVFAYRPVPQRTVVLRALVTRLFMQQRVRGILHLLGDDRGAAGAGESTFRRGLCWAGPITRVGAA
ncbi:MAG TPA: STAS domain-containing protein [Gemmatimonadales bacterium]|nr:STAS domain-containing protein [Gemmatimonadales bacterium]